MTNDGASPDTRAPVEPARAPVQTPPKNPLRRTALIVVAITVLLFALSVAMERLTPSSSQAVIQAYVVRMASEVAGRVIEVGVTDNARVTAGQVLFRIDPQP
jgi:multidrug resistance efflux pump